jgi:arylsulfatase A-like enzyme
VIIGTNLFTTLSKIAGAKLPTDRIIDGIDVGDAFRGKTLEARTLLWALGDADWPDFAIRRGEWKLLLDESQQPVALYNLETDPLELIDVVNQHTDIVEMLMSAFRKEMKSIEADPLRPHRRSSNQ